jgi:hypothetical protein
MTNSIQGFHIFLFYITVVKTRRQGLLNIIQNNLKNKFKFKNISINNNNKLHIVERKKNLQKAFKKKLPIK